MLSLSDFTWLKFSVMNWVWKFLFTFVAVLRCLTGFRHFSITQCQYVSFERSRTQGFLYKASDGRFSFVPLRQLFEVQIFGIGVDVTHFPCWQLLVLYILCL